MSRPVTTWERDANPALGKDGHSFVPHVFERWAGQDGDTWCKWCNTALLEVPGMHAGTPGLPSPAPWSLGAWGHNGSGIDDANGHRIAGLRWAGGSVSMRVTFEEWLANGRLMVAAPDLLAALELVADRLELWTAGAEAGPGLAADRWAVERARAAIVRATTGGNGGVGE